MCALPLPLPCMFKAKIIRSDRYKTTKPLLGALGIMVFICFLLLGGSGRRTTKGLLNLLGLSGWEPLFLVILLVVGAIYLFLEIYSRTVNGYGHLLLAEDSITLSVNGEETRYTLTDVSEINITHNSFVGQDYVNDPEDNFKGQNVLRFVHKGLRYTCEFQVDSIYLSNKLKQALETWSGNGVVFTYRQI